MYISNIQELEWMFADALTDLITAIRTEHNDAMLFMRAALYVYVSSAKFRVR